MALKTMYSGIANSPETELTENISANDTSITVLNASVLPPAPNLATIGTDETAETIRYTEINGNTLTVERGVEGIAKSWSAGTKIARMYTNYDHETFKENIETLQQELDKTKSDLVSQEIGKGASMIGINDPNNRFSSTNVEGALNELFQFANNGKSSIATVIGSPAKTSDTFAQLANTLQTLKNDLVSIMGVGAGTDAFNALINTSLDAKRDELANKLGASTSLTLHALLNNTSGNALQYLKNLLATNLTNKGQTASGTETLSSLVGKVANIQTGKKWASGTTRSSSSTVPGYNNMYTLTVSGLDFKPSIIIANYYGTSMGIYFKDIYDSYSLWVSRNGLPDWIPFSSFDGYVNNTGFKIIVPNGGSIYNWIAIE